jgi:hypothetical protein
MSPAYDKSTFSQQINQIQQTLARAGLSEQRLEVFHEFAVLDEGTLALVADSVRNFGSLPATDPSYAQVVLTLTSALAASGQVDEAEALLLRGRSRLKGELEGLVNYNLFQLRLRRGAQDDAADALLAALRNDATRFALHDPAKHTLQRLLGAGAMGPTLLVEEKGPNRSVVALKGIWEPIPGAGEAAFGDVQRLRELKHPSIIVPQSWGYAVPAEQRQPYFVYERIAGGALNGAAFLAKNGALKLDQWKDLGARLIQTLAAAHQIGVLHLDLKPENLMFKRTGPTLEFQVNGFGLARAGTPLGRRAAAQPDGVTRSAFGQTIALGLDYAAPEQIGRGPGQGLDVRADIYAFASTMIRLLTNDRPQLLSREHVANDKPLYELLVSCRADDPAERPASFADLARFWEVPQRWLDAVSEARRAAQAAAVGLVSGADAEAAGRTPNKNQGSKLPIILGAVGVVVVAVAVVLFLVLGGKKQEGPAEKKPEDPTAKVGVSPQEFSNVGTWYRESRQKVQDFLGSATACAPFHKAGYKFQSRFKYTDPKTRKAIDLVIQPVEGNASGSANVFECPIKVAEAHRDHPVTITMKMSFTQGIFGRGNRSGSVTLEGKLLDYLQKTTFRGGVIFGDGVFGFPALKDADDEGIRILGGTYRLRLTATQLTLANLVFDRQNKTAGIDGHWLATVRTEEFKKKLGEWAEACPGAMTGLAGKDEPSAEHKLHQKLVAAARDFGKAYCAALGDLHRAVDPTYSEDGVRKAAAALQAARKAWNDTVHQPYVDIAQKLQSPTKDPGL